MSSTLTANTPRINATLSPAAFIRSLPEHFKSAVLNELLRELAKENPDRDAVTVADEAADRLVTVFFAHSDASAADEMFAKLDSRTRREVMKPFLDFDWDDCLSAQELSAIGHGA